MWCDLKLVILSLKAVSEELMCSDVKDRFVSESFSFRYDFVEKCYFYL